MSISESRPELRVVADAESVCDPGPGLRSSIEEGFVARVSTRIRKGELASPARLRHQRIKARRTRVRVVRGVAMLSMIGLVGFSWLQLHSYIESAKALAERLDRVEALVSPVATAGMTASSEPEPVMDSASNSPAGRPSLASSSTVSESVTGMLVSEFPPAQPKSTLSTDELNPYTLRKRDTLWTVVGRAYKLNGDQLARAVNVVREINGIENDRRLMPGQKILLPDASLFAQ